MRVLVRPNLLCVSVKTGSHQSACAQKLSRWSFRSKMEVNMARSEQAGSFILNLSHMARQLA